MLSKCKSLILLLVFLGIQAKAIESSNPTSVNSLEATQDEVAQEVSSELVEGAPTATVRSPASENSKLGKSNSSVLGAASSSSQSDSDKVEGGMKAAADGASKKQDGTLAVKTDFNPEVEAKIRIVAKKRLYPGGHDEEDLKVQSQLFVPEKKMSSKKKALHVENQED